MLRNRKELAEWKREVLRSMRLPRRSEQPPACDAAGRRGFLKETVSAIGAAAVGAGLLSCLPRSPLARVAHADEPDQAVKTGTFFFPRLKFSVKDETHDIWFTYPLADVIIRKNLMKLTNVNASQEPVVVSLADIENMCKYPFVFMTSEGYFDIPKNEEANLKEFLNRGGFIHADDCVWGRGMGGRKTLPSDMPDGVFRLRPKNSPMDGDRFFYDFVKMVQKLFPENPVRRVPNDHEIYHCYFDFPAGCPHMQGVEHGGWGIFEKGTGRIMSFATPGDLHCGWTCMFFGEARNMESIKMGINIIIYFLTH